MIVDVGYVALSMSAGLALAGGAPPAPLAAELAVAREADHIQVTIRNSSADTVCLAPNHDANPRFTLTRETAELPRHNDFEGRPMIGDTCLEGGGTLSFRKTLTSVYPQARAGDRLCYVLGWRNANRSLRHVRSCLLIG